jgi:hypothetical protein
MKEHYPELYKKVFYEEGMADLVPVMVDQLGKTLKTWKDILGVLEGDEL